VIDVYQTYLDIGYSAVFQLADTTGMASPRPKCMKLCDQVRNILALECHPTFGRTHGGNGPLTNALAGCLRVYFQLDASLGGIGGCPFASGATGNICTEDLVHMLKSRIDLDYGRCGLTYSYLRHGT